MGSVLPALLAIFGTLITISTVYASFRVTRNTQATAVYRATAEGWEAQSKLQDQQIATIKADSSRHLADLSAAAAEKDQKIADLTARVEVLQDMVTGKSLLEEHHRAFQAKSSELLALVADTRTEVRAVHTLLTSGKTP